MTIETEQLRHTAEVLDVLTSKLPENHPLRARSVQDAKNCVALIYSAADLIDALEAEVAQLREALKCIAQTKTKPGDDKAELLLASAINLAFTALAQHQGGSNGSSK